MNASAPDNHAGGDATDARWSALMARAQEGDSRAYATLLGECRPLLRRICLSRLRDTTEAEDAVQDTMLTLHLIRHTYDPARPFRPWIAAIAERRAIDRGRRRARRQRGEEAFGMDDLTGTPPPVPRDGIAERRLPQALRALPQAQRTALNLTKLEELSLVEASHRSGMTVGALKVATHRALRGLRRHFGMGG